MTLGIFTRAPLRMLALTSGVALATAFAVPVQAQTETPPAASADFSDEQLAAFADAALAVAAIREEYSTALAQAESEEDQQALIAEGNGAMLEAVETTPGITVEEYIVIGEAASADPELGERLAMLIETRAAE